jgi:multiple sugar transport system ATP-binding protein
MTMGDRIAVMNNGVLEQCGDPETIYERPANVFVAGFIGSPAMSFLECSTAPADGAVLLARGGLQVQVAGAPPLPGEVTVGVRPEVARAWVDGAGLAGPLDGEVDYVEALGRETFVGVTIEGTQLVVHHDGRAALAPGDRLRFGLVPAGLRYFDTATGLALAAEAQPSTTPSI